MSPVIQEQILHRARREGKKWLLVLVLALLLLLLHVEPILGSPTYPGVGLW